MGRFIATSLSLLALVVGFNLASGVVDGWLARMRLSGSSASAQAPAAPMSPAGTGSLAAGIPASGSASGSAAIAPATGSLPATSASGAASTSVAVAPATGSTPTATDSIYAAADTIIGAGTDSAVVAIPLEDEYEGDVYNRVPNDYLAGVGWRKLHLVPTGKDEFSVRAARSASAAIEGTLQVGGAVFDPTRSDLPDLSGSVAVERGSIDPIAPKRLTGYLASLPETGPQFAAVFDFDCNGDAEACSQAIGVRVLEVFERQVATQNDPDNWPLGGFGLRDAVFTNTGNPGYWKTAVFQGILLNGGRRSSRGAIARGEIFLTTSLVDNDPQRVEGYLRTPGRPTASFRIAECAGWGPCADELGKLLAFRLAVVLDVANTPPATGGVPRSHGTP